MRFPRSICTRMPRRLPRQLRPVAQVMYFDGMDDYVALGFGVAAPFTVIAWVSYATFLSTKYTEFISQGVSYADRAWHLGHNPYAPNQYIARIYFTDGRYATIYSLTRPQTNVWYCLALVVDTNSATLYVNAKLDASESYNNIVKSTGTIDVGRLANVADEYFPGLINEILIYSRALSQNEIAWNYNNPDNPVRDGLVLWFHWDSIDIRAGKWYDKSGYGNHGTIYGATLVELPMWQVEAQLWS